MFCGPREEDFRCAHHTSDWEFEQCAYMMKEEWYGLCRICREQCFNEVFQASRPIAALLEESFSPPPPLAPGADHPPG